MPGTLLFDELKDELRDSIVFSYRGSFDNSVVNDILKQVKLNLAETGQNKLLVKKTYNVMVEAVENVLKHCQINSSHVREDKEGLTILSMEEDIFTIAAGNLIPRVNKQILQSKLDELNGMTTEELKKTYSEAIQSSQISDKGGAGLGLLDIARKSNIKLEYSFTPFDNAHYYFILKTKITIT